MNDLKVFQQNKTKVLCGLFLYCAIGLLLAIMLKRIDCLLMLIVGAVWIISEYTLQIIVDGYGIKSKNVLVTKSMSWQEVEVFRLHAVDGGSDEIFLLDGNNKYIRFNKNLKNYKGLVEIITRRASNVDLKLDDYYKEEK